MSEEAAAVVIKQEPGDEDDETASLKQELHDELQLLLTPAASCSTEQEPENEQKPGDQQGAALEGLNKTKEGDNDCGIKQEECDLTYSCVRCEFKAPSKSELDAHKRRTHAAHYCEICDRTCTSEWHLKTHMKAAHSDLLLLHASIDIRGSLTNIRAHMDYTYLNDSIIPYSCKFCDKRVATLDKIMMHLRSHTGEKPYSCESCDYKAAYLSSLKQHELFQHSDLPPELLKPFRCKTCDKSFKTNKYLVEHERTHTGKRPFSCDLCDYTARLEHYVQTHKLAVHSDLPEEVLKPFHCETCEMRFPSQGKLNRHLKVHSKARSYECSECKVMFKEKYNLTVHMKQKHGEEEDVKQMRKYLCGVCDKAFFSKRDLEHHSVVHTKGEGIVHCCAFCEFKSHHIKSVIRHHKVKHEVGGSGKQFPCQVCGKTFENSSKLKRHGDTHLDKSERAERPRPFGCSVCDYRAFDKVVLKKHEEVKHPQTPRPLIKIVGSGKQRSRA